MSSLFTYMRGSSSQYTAVQYNTTAKFNLNALISKHMIILGRALQITLGYRPKCCGVWHGFMLHTCLFTNKQYINNII